MLFRARNLWKIYGEPSIACVEALRGVSFEIEHPCFVAITGPSGSGKSTLMHLLGLMDSPSRGDLWIDGLPVSGLSGAEMTRLRRESIGFVFQAFNLLPRLTVLENLLLPQAYSGNLDRAKAFSLLERVGIAHRASHLPNALSGGERQRAAIARALTNSPRVILADEPTGNLDSENSAKIMSLFDDLFKAGHSIILVTHDPEVASRARKQIRIRDGQILC